MATEMLLVLHRKKSDGFRNPRIRKVTSMNTFKGSVSSRLTGLLAIAGFVGIMGAQTPPDNTKMNKGDGSKTAVTADQQKMNTDDRALTQKIRKSVTADKSLSTYAHNVKIISQNGMVTLKGPVRSEDEKKAITAKAVEAAGGADKVTDELTVKP
jgi:hyperosmotically inducible periplasmic protein